MQFSKASKKTRNTAEETTSSAPQISAAGEGTPKPRNTRSSKTKKAETTESAPVNHNHRTTAAPLEKAKAVAAGASSTVSSIVDPVGVVAPAAHAETAAPAAFSVVPEVSREQIAQLAYSYWIARGYADGGAEQDWLRAERELNVKR